MKLLGAILLALAAAPAAAWNLVDCPPEVVRTWEAHDRELRAAKPGSPLYLPKPYPAGREEVLADYTYELRRLLADAPPASLPRGAGSVLEGLKKGTLRYEVVRVENWSPTRCVKERRLDAYHLVRVFDAKGGDELSRSVLEESGRIGVVSMTLEDEPRGTAQLHGLPLRSPETALAEVRARWQVAGGSPQHVTTFGTLRCPNYAPCLAFRGEAGRVFVLSYEGELFEVEAAGRRYTLGKDVGSAELNGPILQSLGPDGRLVSLGGKAFATARRRAG